MSKLPRFTAAETIRALRRAGWEAQLKHATRSGRVTVAIHAGRIIGPRVLRSILAQAGLTVDEFNDLL